MPLLAFLAPFSRKEVCYGNEIEVETEFLL